MPTTREELDQFHQFAIEQISHSGSPLKFDDLVTTWRQLRERVEVQKKLQEALAEMDAGLGRPAREVMEEIRVKYNLPMP